MDSPVNIYGARIDYSNSTQNAYGLFTRNDATGGSINAYNVSIAASGGTSLDVYRGNSTAELNLYNCNYDKTGGNAPIGGTHSQQGKSVYAYGISQTFTFSEGNIFVVDPGGSIDFDPSGNFPPWTEVKVINVGSAAEIITFDSYNSAISINPGKRGDFILDDTGTWH